MMKCPNCNTELKPCLNELQNYKLSVEMKHDGLFLDAKTVGGTINNFEKLLKAVAKANGQENKIFVAFGGAEQEEHKVTLHFYVMDKANKQNEKIITEGE